MCGLIGITVGVGMLLPQSGNPHDEGLRIFCKSDGESSVDGQNQALSHNCVLLGFRV